MLAHDAGALRSSSKELNKRSSSKELGRYVGTKVSELKGA